MPTAKQIAANRLNGVFATHQIMFDETAGVLAELAAEYHELHCPSDPGEHFLVDALLHNEWRLRRMRRVEANLWQTANLAVQVHNLNSVIAVPDPCSSGDASATDSPTFERLQRVVTSCERSYLPRPQRTAPPRGRQARPNGGPRRNGWVFRGRRAVTPTFHTQFREIGSVPSKSASSLGQSPRWAPTRFREPLFIPPADR
jgi:hypothetical protein